MKPGNLLGRERCQPEQGSSLNDKSERSSDILTFPQRRKGFFYDYMNKGTYYTIIVTFFNIKGECLS